MSSKFLVTGGAGFIGSNIVERLLKEGHTVRVIDNFATGKRENLKRFENDIELIEGDIRSYHVVQQAVRGIEIILHQAALPSVPRSINDPITTNEVNVGGTLNILDAARDGNVRRVVFASSSSVYGDNPVLPKVESMIPNPLSPYAVSKLAGEKYCEVYSKIYGIETAVLRYFNVFGPHQDPTSQYSAVIPRFIKAIQQDIHPVVFGDGEQSRDFTYVANVVEANIRAAIQTDFLTLTVNCATGERITINKLIDHINHFFNKEVKAIYNPERKGDIKHSHAEINLIKDKLNYTPVVSFADGINRTLKFFSED